MSEAVKVYKMVMTPFVVCRSETWSVAGMGMRGLDTWEGKNIEEFIWTSGRTRNMENKN